MFCKLQEKYEKWRLSIGIKKTKFMRVGDTFQNQLKISDQL